LKREEEAFGAVDMDVSGDAERDGNGLQIADYSLRSL